MMKYADNNERPGILNQLYFSMAQKLLPPKPKAAPDHLSALQVQYLGDGNIGGGNVGDGNVGDGNVDDGNVGDGNVGDGNVGDGGSGVAVGGGCGSGKGLIGWP